MPVIENSSYRPPILLKNNHVQTVVPTLFRKVDGINYTRERISTPDGDFIDIDISSISSDKALILSHGLEGNSQRHYIKGMIKAFHNAGYDGIAFNMRGCSGVPNKRPETYHSGKTEDLHTVIQYILKHKNYKEISLVGFSLGANLTLKYVGEMGSTLHSKVKSAVAISAPCDLISSSIELHKAKNYIYAKRFLISLLKKMDEKRDIIPPEIWEKRNSIKTLRDFDNVFTAPLNGFRDAEDYWKKCSCKNFLSGITIPALIINSADDPILGTECYPIKEAQSNKNLFLEITKHGGHMGYITFSDDGQYWHERRTVQFISDFS
ncbi:MAG TPA: alpha/beta fold hydrolase [Spirochaetota bacterium]|mgnify:FL=1|nr:alpha/beta fold hydrolase [Spirochaetota bacterium]HOQ12899.1 alpha/beta fold hydrolase [Spirochaetota bacterium]HOV09486.1 alpha/beta fold hydrolase [Spirochaetota bacterium]